MLEPAISERTISDRVALGVASNRTEECAIVPFPTNWDPEHLTLTCIPTTRARLTQLQNEGWKISHAYFYHDDQGRRIFAALRLDLLLQRKKQVLPIRATKAVGNNPSLELRALDAPRPLYNLHHLAARPSADVIVVEGEKTADAASKLFPDHVATTWPGGAQGVNSADLRPLPGVKSSYGPITTWRAWVLQRRLVMH